MRRRVDKALLGEFMEELARAGRGQKPQRVLITGGGTAVLFGWREGTIDVDIAVDREEILRDVPRIKEKLRINVELAKPSDFVPPLPGEEKRHLFIREIGLVRFLHYDPYGQFLSKAVRWHASDRDDARNLVSSGLVNPAELLRLVTEIPEGAYLHYPHLSKKAVRAAVEEAIRA